MNDRHAADKYECGANQAHAPVCGPIFMRDVDRAIKNFQNAMILPLPGAAV
jgi:hypothetical protein